MASFRDKVDFTLPYCSVLPNYRKLAVKIVLDPITRRHAFIAYTSSIRNNYANSENKVEKMTTDTMGNSTSEVLYFAYGSNLSPFQMNQRCPNSVPVGLAHLSDWRWLINERGYANIVKIDPRPQPSGDGHDNSPATTSPGVYGVLYRLDPYDEVRLDVCEGVPWAYEKQHVRATIILGKDPTDGDSVEVLAYIDFKRVLPSLPKSEYVGRMNRGIREAMKDWNLPESYVDEVMRPFIPQGNDEEPET